jgi:hypothetical protein
VVYSRNCNTSGTLFLLTSGTLFLVTSGTLFLSTSGTLFLLTEKHTISCTRSQIIIIMIMSNIYRLDHVKSTLEI